MQSSARHAAAAQGQPLVICLPEIFGDSVYYIDPYNYDVDFETLLSGKVSPASEVLEKYSWEKTASKTLEVVKRFF